MSLRIVSLLLVLLLVACGKVQKDSQKVQSDSQEDPQFAFTCAHEKDPIPPRNPEADQLVRYADWLSGQSPLQRGAYYFPQPAYLPEEARLYRIAAAWGHDIAASRLIWVLISDYRQCEDCQVEIKTQEIKRQAENLIAQGIPKGYYHMAKLLESHYTGLMADRDINFYKDMGRYDLTGDREAALSYLRKAADLGSPDAQSELEYRASGLDIDRSNPAAEKMLLEMRKCAADQGDASALYGMGYANRGSRENYAVAARYYQMAVKNGSHEAASELYRAFGKFKVNAKNEDSYKKFIAKNFRPGEEDNVSDAEDYYLEYKMHNLGFEHDEERQKRYEEIENTLTRYHYFNGVTVDEIDEIVPLPPAELPPWDGKLNFVKNWESDTPPPLPSEKRIAEMAHEKGLDPETGLPPPPPAQPEP
jgi:TPR repeat protein